jgi:hypothetical protein
VAADIVLARGQKDRWSLTGGAVVERSGRGSYKSGWGRSQSAHAIHGGFDGQ